MQHPKTVCVMNAIMQHPKTVCVMNAVTQHPKTVCVMNGITQHPKTVCVMNAVTQHPKTVCVMNAVMCACQSIKTCSLFVSPPPTHTYIRTYMCTYSPLLSSSSPQTVLDFYRLLHAVDQKAPQWVHVDLVCDILYLPLSPCISFCLCLLHAEAESSVIVSVGVVFTAPYTCFTRSISYMCVCLRQSVPCV